LISLSDIIYPCGKHFLEGILVSLFYHEFHGIFDIISLENYDVWTMEPKPVEMGMVYNTM